MSQSVHDLHTRRGLAALASWCVAHARVVIGAWVIAALAVLVAGLLVGSHFRTVFRLPGTDSQRATNLINANFPDRHGDREQLALHARVGTFADPARRLQAERLLARISTVPGVAGVVDPFHSGENAAISADRRTTAAEVVFGQPTDQVPTSSVQRLLSIANAERDRFLDVGVAGQAVENVESNSPGAGEGIAAVAAIVVLLIGFGTAAAVGIAMATAMLALSVGFGAMALVSHVVSIPTFATQIATTIGLGIGIDYALLVLARYRSATHAGLDPPTAAIAAMSTAGRAVVFAGGTVMLAMLGLFVVGLPFIQGMGLGVILVVIPTILAATTVLPAILGHAGGHLDRWRPPGLRGREFTGRSPAWAHWARRVQRRPILAMCAALALLGLLAAPALSMRLASAEANTDNHSTASHRAYEYTSQAFGAGFTRPFDVVATLPTRSIGNAATTALSVQRVLQRTAGVAAVSRPEVDTTHQHLLFSVYPRTPPTSPRTAALLRQLRGPIRAQLNKASIGVAVGGPAAITLDLSHTIAHAVPLVLAAVIGTSLLLLLVLFRSVVVALKAGLMNLLAISAAFGVVVAVFQWGWAIHLFGVDYAGPIEVFLPILLFPTVFGLSMDYEVFLLTRIRDEWDHTHDNTAAVSEGLASTGRVVTAGAAIMIVLFASLVFANARTVKIFGLGLAMAILLDALIVRSVLLPATMQLLGRVNWWLPGWLDTRLPRLALDVDHPAN